MHANGNSWWELGSEGTIDMYAANSINMRTNGDINLHADKNINLNATDKIGLYSEKDLTIETDENLNLIGKRQAIIYSKTKIGVKSDGSLAIDASSNASWKSGGSTEIKGATIGLNNGSAQSVSAPKELTKNSHADALINETLGWLSQDNILTSIASRVTTHEPFNGHNTGISDVKPFDES